MDYIEASNYKQWKKFSLLDYADYADCVTYCNQSEYGDGQLSGDWYYVDDEKRVVYVGSFGNDNAPGADHYTSAEVFMGDEELTGEMTYAERVAELEAMPEYAPTDDEEEEAESQETT